MLPLFTTVDPMVEKYYSISPYDYCASNPIRYVEAQRKIRGGHNFMNQPGQVMPEITDEYAQSVADRYIELYEHIVGKKFQPAETEGDIAARIEKNVTDWLNQHGK